MWKRAHSSGDLSAEVMRSQEVDHGSTKEAVKSIFNTTRCYDLMQNSCKIIVFETEIPFQLAFYALVEQDAEIAPIWDPRSRRFIAMMTSPDFVQALWKSYCDPQAFGGDLASRSIQEMLTHDNYSFRHAEFSTVDAEDTVYQMCRLLQRQGSDFVPVADPDEGNLVSVLGYLDIINLLDTAARQFPELFTASIGEANIGTYRVVTAPDSANLVDVLKALEERKISSIPIVNNDSQVIGLYYKSDVSFITKSQDPDAILSNLATLLVGQVMKSQVQRRVGLNSYIGSSGNNDSGNSNNGNNGASSGSVAMSIDTPDDSYNNNIGAIPFCTCELGDTIKEVLAGMMAYRVSRVVIVDNMQRCLGILSIKDIVLFYLEPSSH